MEKNIWFTSDPHFFHKNIMDYENRPFNSVEEMNSVMIENWNKKVKKNESIYILGDFSFGKKQETSDLIDKLNGTKYLIIGNHDKHWLKSKECKDKFVWVKDYHSEMFQNGLYIVMFHYPIANYDRRRHGSLHLFGHIHSQQSAMGEYVGVNPELTNRYYNVGVDVNNFTPISLNEIINKLDIKLAPKEKNNDK